MSSSQSSSSPGRLNKMQQTLALMQKSLECSICLELMKNPVSTKCDHQFCRFCVTEYLRNKPSAPCPLCKKNITKRSLSARNKLSQIVDAIRKLVEAFQEDSGILFSPPRGPGSDVFSCTPQMKGSPRITSPGDRKRSSPQEEYLAEENVVNEKNRKNLRYGKRKKSEGQDLVYIEDGVCEESGQHTVVANTNIYSSFPRAKQTKGKRCRNISGTSNNSNSSSNNRQRSTATRRGRRSRTNNRNQENVVPSIDQVAQYLVDGPLGGVTSQDKPIANPLVNRRSTRSRQFRQDPEALRSYLENTSFSEEFLDSPPVIENHVSTLSPQQESEKSKRDGGRDLDFVCDTVDGEMDSTSSKNEELEMVDKDSHTLHAEPITKNVDIKERNSSRKGKADEIVMMKHPHKEMFSESTEERLVEDACHRVTGAGILERRQSIERVQDWLTNHVQDDVSQDSGNYGIGALGSTEDGTESMTAQGQVESECNDGHELTKNQLNSLNQTSNDVDNQNEFTGQGATSTLSLAKKIFRTRFITRDEKKDTFQKMSAAQEVTFTQEDPYEFVVSQHTPRKPKGRRGRGRGGGRRESQRQEKAKKQQEFNREKAETLKEADTTLFAVPDEKEQDKGTERRRRPRSKNRPEKVPEESQSTQSDVQKMIDKISEAESHELMLSQAFREQQADVEEACVAGAAETETQSENVVPPSVDICNERRTILFPSNGQEPLCSKDNNDSEQELKESVQASERKSNKLGLIQKATSSNRNGSAVKKIAPADWSSTKEMAKDLQKKKTPTKLKLATHGNKSSLSKKRSFSFPCVENSGQEMEKEVQIMDPTTPCIPVTDEDTVSPSLQSSVVKDMNEDDREQGSDTESVDLALSQVEFQKSNLDVDPEPVSTAKSGDLEASGKRESGETEQSESLLLLRQQSIDPACMKVSSVETISLSSQDEAVSPGHLGQGHLIKGQVEGHIGEVQGQNSNTKDLPLTEDCVVLVTQEDQAPAGVPNPSMFNQMKGESSQNHDAPAKMVDAEEDVDKSCSEVGENVVAELSEKTKSPVKIIPESDENICSEKEEVGTTASCPLEKLEYPHLDVTLHIKKSNRKTFSLDPVTPTKPGSEPSKPGSEKVKRTSASKFVLPSLDDSLFENTPLLSPLGDNLEMPSVGESQYNIHGSNPSEKLGATCDMNLKDCQDSQGSGSNMGKDVQLVTLCMEQSTVIDGTSRGSQGSGSSQEKIAPKANEENNRLNASFESPCVISDDIVPATEGASRDESPAFIAPAKCCKLYEKSGSTEVSPAISVPLNQGAVHMDAYENSSVEDDRYKRSKSKKRKSETEGEDTNNEQSCKRSRSSLGHGSKVTQQSQVLHQNSRHENKSSNTSPQDIPDSFKAKSEITINSEEPNASNNARVPNIEVELTDENGDISDDLEQGEEEEGRLEDLISKEYDSISMTNFVDPSCEILEPVNQKSPSSTTGLDEELDNDSTCGSLADDVEDGDLDNGVKVGGLDEGVIDLEDNDLEPVEDKDEVIDVDSNSSSDSKHSGGCLERKPKVVNIRGRRILESDSSSEDGEAEEEETIEASAKQLETQCNESRYKQDIGDLASQEDEVLSKSDKLKVGSRNLASQGETKSMKTTSPSSRLSSRNHRKKLSDLAVCSDDEDEADHQRTSSIEFSHVPEGSHTWPQSQSLSILQPLGHIPTNKELRLQNENTMDDTTDDDELPDIHPPSKKSPRASTSKSYSNTPTRKQSGKIPMMENGNDFQSPGSRVSCNAPSVGRNDFVSPVTRLGIPTIGKRLKSPLLLMTSGTRNQSPRPGVSCNTPSGEKSEFLSPLAKEKVSQLEKPEPSPYPCTDSLNKGRGHKLSNQQNLSDDEEHIEEHDPKYPRDTSESETPVERNYSEDLFTAEKAVEETEEDNRYPDSSVSTEKDMQGEGQSANRYPTSSFSSESEALLTTQQQRQTEAELERLQREMERLKAALNQGVRTDAVQSQTDKKKDAAEDNIRSSDEEPDNMSVNDSGDDLFVSPRPPSPPPVKVAKETSSTSHVERTPEIQKLTEFIDHYKSKDGTTVSKTTQQANANNSSETRKSKSPCVIKDTPDRTMPGSVRNSPGSGKNTQGSGDCKMSRESSPFRKDSTCLRQNDPQTLKTNIVQCSGNQERTRNHGGQEKPETSDQLCSGWTKEVDSGRTGKVMSIVATGLGKHEISTIKNFGDRFGGKFWARYNSGTTHVIVKPDVKHPLACERTLKYFMGIAGRRWVVSYKWIEDCLNQDKLIPETQYEIRGDMVNGVNHRGPQRARQTSDDQLLLRGYEICCAGGYTGLAIDDLKNLVELCGGATVQDPSMFSFQPGSKRVVLIQPSEQGVDRNKCDKIYKKYSAMTLNREWLLDSVALYRVQHWGEYVLCSRKLVKDDDTEVIDID